MSKLHSFTMIMFILIGAIRTWPACASEVRIALGPYGRDMVITQELRSIKEIREEGITLQRLDYSCGTAALSTLFTSYLRQPYTEGEIIEFILRTGNIDKILVRKGFSLLDLKRFAEAHGIKATGYALDFPSLMEFQCPVLVPLYHTATKMRHFVIVRGIVGDRIFLADPAVGRRIMLRADFEKEWEPKVGMVFEHPDFLTTGQDTPLGIQAQDATFLTGASLRAVVLQSVDEYIHRANEF
ncbi:MAG TPA: C39 family peptidase [Armatimonadota bacterium]